MFGRNIIVPHKRNSPERSFFVVDFAIENLLSTFVDNFVK